MSFSAGGGSGSGNIAGATDVALSSPANGQVLGYDSGTAKWKNSPQAARLVEGVNLVSAAGAAQTLPDVTVATMHQLKLSVATCVLTLPAAVAGKSLLLELVQDGTGSRKVTWPGSLWWQGGVQPTLTTTPNKSDVFSFISIDGAKWFGFQVGQGF